MNCEDYSEYTKFDVALGDKIILQECEISDAKNLIEVIINGEIDSEYCESSFYLTSDQARFFAGKLRRYADKVDGVCHGLHDRKPSTKKKGLN